MGVILWGLVLFMLFSFVFFAWRAGRRRGITNYGAYFCFQNLIHSMAENTIKIVSAPIRSRLQTRNPLSSPLLSVNSQEINHGK
jgi:hypothetical protein